MLSLLLARQAGDAAAETALRDALPAAGDAPAALARCMARPDESTCLAVP